MNKKIGRKITLGVLVLGLVTLNSSVAVRADDRSHVPSADDLAELTADWWQWAYGQPVSTSPLFDATGALARNGQTGDVFFLCGAIAPFNNPIAASAERWITVPPGKAIFFPILNAEAANKDTPPGGLTEQQSRQLVANFLFPTSGVYATLDRVPIPYQRILSPVFTYTLPKTKPGDQNIDQFFGVDITGKVPGTVSDGLWVYLPPLSKKTTHTITFGGKAAGNFTLNIIYHITVP
jgi:hypothetical protein